MLCVANVKSKVRKQAKKLHARLLQILSNIYYIGKRERTKKSSESISNITFIRELKNEETETFLF